MNAQARAMTTHLAAMHCAVIPIRGVKRAQMGEMEIFEKLIDVGQGCRSICCTSKSVEQPGCRSLSRA